MFEISRRDLVLGSTGAALVFGLKGPVSFIGAAHAQRAADSLKYKVGDIEVFSLHEGSIERAVTEAMVKNASLDDVKKALTAAGIGPDKIDNPFTVTAIRTGGKVVLFDTGFGGNGPATVGKLADNMKAAGLDPALVEKVPEANRPFIKRIQATFPTWKNIKQYNDGADVAPGVKAIATPGHTVGHMSFLVASGGQQLFIQSDVTGIYQLFVRNPGWFSGFDADGPKA